MNFVGSESESVESDSSEECVVVAAANKKETKTTGSVKSNVDLLLELDDCEYSFKTL